MLQVVALACKLALCPCDRLVTATLDECAHGALDLLRFCLARDRSRHGEQRGVPPRDAFLVRDAYLELDARVLVEVV